MKFSKIASIAIGLGMLSSPVLAGTINLYQTINLNQFLNDQNPTISGSFDLSTALSGIADASDMTNVSARIIAYGYSTVDNIRTETYGDYYFLGSEVRQTFPGASYTESYSCGFSTCYRTIIVLPRYARDDFYARDHDIRNIDNVIDEMMVEIGSTTYTDTVDAHRTNYRYTRLRESVSGTNGGGYTYLYADERTTTDQYFGRLYLNQDISGLIASSIDFTQDILNWSMSAPLGQFQAQQINLQLSFNTATIAANIPEPGMAYLFGIGFAFMGWRARKSSGTELRGGK
ncbi:MAG: hypothetical protein GXP00_11085 [Alphaproteobacteria bacterium]|nr:hypothetical protein [Alphaproteobacteria bacterium]